MSEPILVTRPYLPPLTELLPLLEQIWETRILTNNGPFHQQLEARLADLFGAPHVSLMANGMLALTAAIDASGISGEIITTPYSFVATAHAVQIGRAKPVFVDVRRSDLNIDPAGIEAAIGPRTGGIVAVHCYGNPCDVDAIESIAGRHGLPVIYDAAHAFGVTYRGRSLLSWGDFATLSFHATKAFNTFEGGAVVAGDAAGKAAIDRIRNFGIEDEVSIPSVGVNAKMSEFNAALGLLQLDHFEQVRAARAACDRLYRQLLAEVAGIECLSVPAETEPNYSYFPILVTADYPLARDGLYDRLKQHGIHARRYFYPLLSTLPSYRQVPSAAPENLPVATRAAQEVLCLPIYPDLPHTQVERIARIIGEGASGGA
ncbi:MAG TPA: DegT/DnrJ/EryC1/StrS family aminotransferase [Allosphingosinicella sp.]|jgi:dTDP-4-amino-4,6-dideoxygalactose transaminase|nr:DegT/DnrJ/EryC1/StrS family aminotransferase [Allosphingosinicella sp.]